LVAEIRRAIPDPDALVQRVLDAAPRDARPRLEDDRDALRRFARKRVASAAASPWPWGDTR
jgi:hypothetical protein